MSLAPAVLDKSVASSEREFMLLVEPLLPVAHRLAVGLLRSESDAEDAVQSALLNAWRHFGRFRRGSDLKPWLLTIVANECRRQRRNRWWSVIKGPNLVNTKSDQSTTDDPAIADLRRALYRLPHEQRLVLILRYYLDLSFEEVAQTLGISNKAARSRTYRALTRLRLSPEVTPDE